MCSARWTPAPRRCGWSTNSTNCSRPASAGARPVWWRAWWEELEAIENDTDRIQVEVRRELFRLESELPPVDVMFLYQIIEWIGDVADRAQQVGNRLEQLLAR
ncbi:DUF47 family protein [Pseudomonas aeruginosa]|nr:DUF47 family protein [Pseudomonas aeruginosa]